MKKLSPALALLFGIIALNAAAQIQTIHNPKSGVTITNEQIIEFGQAGKSSDPGLVLLNFEGLANLEPVGQFYNGGAGKSGLSGTNHAVNFSANALAIIDSKHGGSGNFLSDILPNTILFFLSGSEIYLNSTQGFSGGLSFYYTSTASGTISVYDGPNGTGTMLTSMVFQPVSLGVKGDPAGYFDLWKRLKIKFEGTAKSVIFSGVENQCAFDDIVLGSGSPGKSGGMAVVSQSTDGKNSFGTMLTTPKSQTDKGKLFLDGSSSMHLSIGSEKSKSDGNVDEGSEYSYFDFNFLPKAGYFFCPNFVGGLFLDIEAYSNKSKDTTGYAYKGTTFIIGPFVRYYVPVTDQFMPFAEAQVGFGIDNYKSRYSSAYDWVKTNESVFTYRIGGGATYFFNDIVGCDLFLGYQHDSYKYKDTGDGSRSSSNSKIVYGEFTMQLGIVVILDL
jgi:hypothetical protein